MATTTLTTSPVDPYAMGTPIEVEGPDGTIVEFPAGTDNATMSSAMQKHFGAPKQPMGAVADVAASGASGVARGATELAMTPATLPKMAADGIMNGAEWLIRKGLGLGDVTPETQAARDQAQTDIVKNAFVPAPDAAVAAIRGGLDGTLHKPQTTAGRYAETIGEFVPTVPAGPGGLGRKVAEAVIPGAMSEAAGETTQGTAAEPYARILGGLTGNLAAVAPVMRAGAADRIVSSAVAGTDPAAFQTAQQLQDHAAALGVPLSGPEALQHVTGGATKLADVQRVIEGSTAGGAATSRFYAQRPGQVSDAIGRTLDQIAPAPLQPSTLGGQAATAAQGAIDDVRRGINTATQPAYQAAGAHVLDPADFAPIASDPAFAASLARLRNDPVLGPTYAHAPDSSVAVIDAVTKDMRDRSVALGNAANPGFSAQTAGLYGSGAAEARDIARNPLRGGVQAYDDALTTQEQARRQNLAPLEQGPLGGVAGAASTQGAYDALLPAQPLAGGTGEVADAASRLHAQDDQIVAALTRQHLADRADTAMRDNAGGPNQNGGALFRKAVAGTDQQRANLAAALGAAGVQSNLPDLLDTLQATGWRKAPGSATAFNEEMQRALGHQGVPAAAAQAVITGGLGLPSMLGRISEASRMSALNRNSGRLGDLLLAPDSATQLAAIAARGAQSPLAEMFARRLPFQAPVEAQRSSP